MSEKKPPRQYTAHQQKIIRRYYDNVDSIAGQRLADLVGELYLSEGKKKEKAWQSVHKAMQQLNDDQRMVVGLVLIEGLPYKEAADVLGIPIGTLTSRLARARDTLQAVLSGSVGVSS